MQLNPYEPNQQFVDKALGNSRFAFSQQIGLVGLLSALVAFGIGVVWIKLLRRNPTEVSPVSWTLAQSVAYGGMAILMIGLVSLVRSRVSRFSGRFANEEKTVFGWNLIPVIVSSLIGVAWFGTGCLGLYLLVVELMNYDFYRGTPVLEIVLQFLLYVSALAATRCCLQANRQWMRNNSGRALILSAVGLFGPLLAYVMLGVSQDLVRSLV
jgi:hypothetical protein